MNDVRFGRFLARVTACHVVTYFVCGVIAYYAFDYAGAFASADVSCYLRPIHSKWIPLGPSLNVVRGFIFALALFPFRSVFLDERYGWLKLWGLLLALCILSTAGPAPGSVEGLIYTQVPWTAQLLGLRETVVQTLAFSYLLVAWHHRPGRAWGIAMGTIMVLVVLAAIGGTLAAQPPSR
jgi:hypothetical protein